MNFRSRVAIIPAAVVACGIGTGCFSYHKSVDETKPAVVQTVPPVVAVPESSSSTTTTTTDSNGAVERQKTTTYSTP